MLGNFGGTVTITLNHNVDNGLIVTITLNHNVNNGLIVTITLNHNVNNGLIVTITLNHNVSKNNVKCFLNKGNLKTIYFAEYGIFLGGRL